MGPASRRRGGIAAAGALHAGPAARQPFGEALPDRLIGLARDRVARTELADIQPQQRCALPPAKLLANHAAGLLLGGLGSVLLATCVLAGASVAFSLRHPQALASLLRLGWLTEQQVSGIIVIENGCVKLTERGRRPARFSRFFRTHLLPRQRLLAGAYTDDLTDPFRHSQAEVDYRCK